jgi:hypothetical protein
VTLTIIESNIISRGVPMRKKSLKFVLMVNLALEIKGDQAQVVVKNIKVKPTAVSLPIETIPAKKGKRIKKKLSKSIHDIILESAKKASKKADDGVFSSMDLFNVAIKKYPELNKKSFNTMVISAAPEHTSWKHTRNGKDYLVYLGKGKYKLRDKTK